MWMKKWRLFKKNINGVLKTNLFVFNNFLIFNHQKSLTIQQTVLILIA